MSQRVLLLCLFLLLSGCIAEKTNELMSSISPAPAETYFVQKETALYQTRAARQKLATLSLGSEIGVLEIQEAMARTDRGWVALADLEKERSYFQLRVKAPEGAAVKILNIKPKYHDGIWLKQGEYLIGVYPKGKAAIKQWLTLDRDETLVMDGNDGKFALSFAVPEGATVKILNIKPKYYDGIRLAPGKYHVAVYGNDCTIYDEWINLTKDSAYPVNGSCPDSGQVAGGKANPGAKSDVKASAAVPAAVAADAPKVEPKKDAVQPAAPETKAENAGDSAKPAKPAKPEMKGMELD